MTQFHLAERECVATAIDAAAAASNLNELYAAIAAYEGHDVAVREPYTPSQTAGHPLPLMIINEKPEPEDREEGRPYSGSYGQIMRNACDTIGVNLDMCHIAYAVHWLPDAEKSPNKTQIAASRPFLFREIELVQPRAILAQGRGVIESLIRYRGAMLDVYGTETRFKHGDLDIPMFMTAHPAFCLYQGTYFSTFVDNTRDFFDRHGDEFELTKPGSHTPVPQSRPHVDTPFKSLAEMKAAKAA